uniref:Mitochondrial inner membrane protein Mpv17 n=1 Tax=Panagrellus redivivus TaxID=6233 RepID=A0A7E4V232_PANRE
MASIFRAYQRLLNTRPLATQMISSGVLGASGDAICQYIIERRTHQSYDKWRTVRFFVLPCFFIAPVLSKWLVLLERVKGHPKIVPLKKLLIDQICYAPFFSASIIFNLRVLEGHSLTESKDMLVRDFWNIYQHSIKYWPCVQLVNFYLMPLNFRVIFVQIAALAWNTFLSFKTQTKLEDVVIPLE